MRDMVVLMNLNSAACRSIARKLRAEHIYCKILPADAAASTILEQEALGIVLAGASTGEPAAIPQLSGLMSCGLPLLGMGDAALTLCTALGGFLGAKASEPGLRQVRFEEGDPLTAEVEAGERYFPACRTTILPDTCRAIASAEEGALGFRLLDKPVYGLAFLPEQNDPDGARLMINFCKSVCGCTLWWSDHAFLERAKEEIDRLSQGGEALCALSGGVDSGVCALLGTMALGHRLHCLFIDTGLLRQGEADEVMAFYRDELGLNVRLVHAQEEFLAALRGITDPAGKERVIYGLMHQILEREAAAIPGLRLILRGTNYSDTLEPPAHFTLPGSQVRLIEPVRELFKDEIRRVGEELQLPPAITQRQPFPGTGLALRILSEVTEDKLALLREADDVFRREIDASGQSKRLWQYFASLADNPVPGAGGYVVTLRAVQGVDGAAAMPSRLPYDLLERVTQAILSRLPGVRRVLYDCTPSESYARIEWH